MPMYTYYCKKCEQFEGVLMSMTQYDTLKDKQVCSVCGDSLDRMIGEDIRYTATIIPEHMKAESNNKWQPNPNRSNRRKLY